MRKVLARPVGWRLRAAVAVGVICLFGACASAPERPAAPPSAPAPAPAPDIAAPAAPAFSSLVASRSASVVDVSTLRIGREARPEGPNWSSRPRTISPTGWPGRCRPTCASARFATSPRA